MTKTATAAKATATAQPTAQLTDAADDRALELRREGKALMAIAAELGLERASEANAAMNRALRRRPVEEQARIRADEEARLNGMAETVRRNEKLSPEDVERRLRAVERLRTALLSE